MKPSEYTFNNLKKKKDIVTQRPGHSRETASNGKSRCEINFSPACTPVVLLTHCVCLLLRNISRAGNSKGGSFPKRKNPAFPRVKKKIKPKIKWECRLKYRRRRKFAAPARPDSAPRKLTFRQTAVGRRRNLRCARRKKKKRKKTRTLALRASHQRGDPSAPESSNEDNHPDEFKCVGARRRLAARETPGVMRARHVQNCFCSFAQSAVASL